MQVLHGHLWVVLYTSLTLLSKLLTYDGENTLNALFVFSRNNTDSLFSPHKHSILHSTFNPAKFHLTFFDLELKLTPGTEVSSSL